MKRKLYLVIPRRSRQRGLSLVELMIAIGISAMAMAMFVSLMIMVQSTMRESIWENNLRSAGALFMEQAKQKMTFAYRNDALVASYRPVINTNKNEIAFTAPDETGDGIDDSFYVGMSNSKLVIRRNGVVLNELKNVSDFFIDTQEGLITFMITIKRPVKIGSRKIDRKQFTLVGRALPRNMGQIMLTGEE